MLGEIAHQITATNPVGQAEDTLRRRLQLKLDVELVRQRIRRDHNLNCEVGSVQ